VTPVVIDASAGVELAADTIRGRALRGLLPANSVPWVPDHFFVECGAVLRRWDLNGVLPPERIASAVVELNAWPLRIAQVRGLFEDAWRVRFNLTFAEPYTSLWPTTFEPRFSPTTVVSSTHQDSPSERSICPE
jgi:predicted nucleic acid-binding protein